MPGWLAWSYLVVAGVLEIVWAIGLKYAAGFSRLDIVEWLIKVKWPGEFIFARCKIYFTATEVQF